MEAVESNADILIRVSFKCICCGKEHSLINPDNRTKIICCNKKYVIIDDTKFIEALDIRVWIDEALSEI
jgi:hypothetical protein